MCFSLIKPQARQWLIHRNFLWGSGCVGVLDKNVDHRKAGKVSLLWEDKQEGNFLLKSSMFFQAKHGRPSRPPAPAPAQRHSDEPAVTNITSANAGAEARLETEMSLLGTRHRSLSTGEGYCRWPSCPWCTSANVSTKVRVSVFCALRRASLLDWKLCFQATR